jgi:peptide chain release factor 2/peptide chain release factor
MPDFDLLVTSGVGPAEARRFVFQLAGSLEQLAESRGLLVRAVELAPRSAVLELRGDAPAVLADVIGTHVLVQRSAQRSRFARKRWFAAVTLHDHVDRATEIAVLDPADLVVTACRAGGPGGQHVNKVASAVRVHHVPSGLAVRSAGERSQKANLDHALRRLAATLRDRADARVADAAGTRRAAHYRVERGRPVRIYHLDDDGALVDRSTS